MLRSSTVNKSKWKLEKLGLFRSPYVLSAPTSEHSSCLDHLQFSSQRNDLKALEDRSSAERRRRFKDDGETAGEVEGSSVRAISVPAEGDDWSLEGPSG